MKKIKYICNECSEHTYAEEEPIKCRCCGADNFGIEEGEKENGMS